MQPLIHGRGGQVSDEMERGRRTANAGYKKTSLSWSVWYCF